MRYDGILPGTFLARPNRFVAQVQVAGQTETRHVKNTGRLANIDLNAPNRSAQPALADAVREARGKGVHVVALGCKVAPNSLAIDGFLPVPL